ncbi:MAG: hypothetical protein V4671_03380, partial [Armatimonadota bacterium]
GHSGCPVAFGSPENPVRRSLVLLDLSFSCVLLSATKRSGNRQRPAVTTMVSRFARPSPSC